MGADIDKQLEPVVCLICGKDETDLLVRAGERKLVRCRHDGLIYLNPRPTLNALRDYHAAFIRTDNLPLFHERRVPMLQREAEAITRFKCRGNLLDIGCGTGAFFERFRNGDWRFWGVDPAFLGVTMAQGMRGAEVFKGTLPEANYPSGFFDVISILDTLYYEPDPKRMLLEVRRVLKDDGILAVEIPGVTHTFLRYRGPFAWLMDGQWTSGLLAISNHLYYFSPRTFRLLLEAAGFRLVKEIPEQASLGSGGAASLVSAAHFTLARVLFKLSRGKLSIAGKELYLAVKSAEGRGFSPADAGPR